jgi:hypothetical protein
VGEVRDEIKVWRNWLHKWVRKPLWSDGLPPVWVQAQDASDTGVGGWLGHLGGLEFFFFIYNFTRVIRNLSLHLKMCCVLCFCVLLIP